MSDLIAALDSALVVAGEDIKLRRSVGTTNQVHVDVDVRAAVRSPAVAEIVPGITQDDLFCIFSPTEINQAQWPGGHVQTTDDVRIPSKSRGDSAYIRGKWRAVQWGQGFYPAGELSRIEMRVAG